MNNIEKLLELIPDSSEDKKGLKRLLDIAKSGESPKVTIPMEILESDWIIFNTLMRVSHSNENTKNGLLAEQFHDLVIKMVVGLNEVANNSKRSNVKPVTNNGSSAIH